MAAHHNAQEQASRRKHNEEMWARNAGVSPKVPSYRCPVAVQSINEQGVGE